MPRLYTYLPKDNTALTDGLLSTALSDKGFEKYRGRTGKYKKDDVLKVMDSWEPEWTRSKAISALTEPIPPDAAEDFLNFARDHKLYSFSTKDLIKSKILAHLRRAREGGGTDPVDEVKKERLNWHRKKKHLLFQNIPHYLVETTGGKIPPEFVREEKQADAHYVQTCYNMLHDTHHSGGNMTQTNLSKIAAVAISALATANHAQEKQAVSFSKDEKHFTLSRGKTPSHVVRAWNKKYPARQIKLNQLLAANKGTPATRFIAGKQYNMPGTSAATPVATAKSKPAAPAKASAPAPAANPTTTNATVAAQRPQGTPIGYWNKNPLNLRSDGRTLWNGATGVAPKGEFTEFGSYSNGVRAASRTLYNYGKLHNIDTVNGVLHRFAPVSDKNPNNTNYAASIQRRTGFAPDQQIDLTDEATLQKLVPAMGKFEIGPKFWDQYSPSVVSNAVTSGIPVSR